MHKRVDSKGNEAIDPSIATGSAGIAFALFKYSQLLTFEKQN